MNNLNQHQLNVLDFVLKSEKDDCQESTFSIVKNEDNCFVAETQHCIYKIREISKDDPHKFFNDIINETFAEQYRKMGIEWKYFPLSIEEHEYRVQKREKLQVVKPQDLSFDEVLIKNSKIKRKTELKLRFPYLMSIIKKHPAFDRNLKIVIARDTDDDFSNYAYFKDEIISLGDSNYFLAFTGENGCWNKNSVFALINLSLNDHKFAFAPYRTMNPESKIDFYTGQASKWWLFPQVDDDGIITESKYFQDEIKLMFSTNQEIVSKKESKEVKTSNQFPDSF